METIHGAELVLLSVPDHDTVLGGLLTMATPMGKHGHWLPLDDSVTEAAMLEMALDYVKRVGIDSVNVRRCHMIEALTCAGEDIDDEELEGDIELDAECEGSYPRWVVGNCHR